MNTIDLHCHTNCSDGKLSPIELVQYAQSKGIQFLSITDHDTVNAYYQLEQLLQCKTENLFQSTMINGHNLCAARINPSSQDRSDEITLITGIEISTKWNKHNIHVVGLGVDIYADELKNLVEKQKLARHQRGINLAKHLAHFGFDSALALIDNKNSDFIGRVDFANHLVEIGAVKDLKKAFEKYLSDKKISRIDYDWIGIEDAIELIHSVGGIAVLAHPNKYKFKPRQVNFLIQTFKDMKGDAIEVVSGLQALQVTQALAEEANMNRLMVSCGSDFHELNKNWADIGNFGQVPNSCHFIL